jgi:hypothetical protein
MAEIVSPPPPLSGPMDGVADTSGLPIAAPVPTALAAAPIAPPPGDEYSCETLYIQNLNEKIKPEGASQVFTFIFLHLLSCLIL